MLKTSARRRAIVATRLFAVAVVVAAAGVAMSGCSPGVEYPSLFPAVHDMPPPRAAATMDADQVQQATEELVTQRNHLSAGTPGGGQAKDATTPAAAAANPAAKKSQAAAAGSKSSGTSGAAPGSAASGTATAGAETK